MKYDKVIISSLVLAAAAITAEACTSWVITPGSSESGRMILHKCRDNDHTKLDADMVTTAKGFRVMRIGADERTLFGLNEKGEEQYHLRGRCDRQARRRYARMRRQDHRFHDRRG